MVPTEYTSLVYDPEQVVDKCHWMKKGEQAFPAFSSLARTLLKHQMFFHLIFICSSGKTATVRKANTLEQLSLKTFLQLTNKCQLFPIPLAWLVHS